MTACGDGDRPAADQISLYEVDPATSLPIREEQYRQLERFVGRLELGARARVLCSSRWEKLMGWCLPRGRRMRPSVPAGTMNG